MMRNIFLKCFNSFKNDCESHITESCALKFMKFSPRLFEIKLSQRRETVAYYEDLDIFVLAEGDAARCYNFHTGECRTRCDDQVGNISGGLLIKVSYIWVNTYLLKVACDIRY